MYDLRALPTNQHVRAFVCVLLWALHSVSLATPVATTDAAFDRFMLNSTGAGKQTVSFGSGGQVLAANGVPSVATAGGPVTVTRPSSIAGPGGAKVPVSVVGKVGGIALGSLLKKALGIIPFLGTGVAIYEVAKELGFDLSKGADGNLSVNQVTVGTPAASSFYPGCETWNNGPCTITPWNSNKNSMSIGPFDQWVIWGNPGVIAWAWQPYYPVGSTSTPKTVDELADAIASKSGWPSGSAVSQAVVDAQKLTGEVVPLQSPTVTGPTTVTSPPKVTTTPDGKTATTTVTNNYQYMGDTITTTTVTNVTNNDPVSNQSTTTTTTETPQEDDPCLKNPETNGCRNDEYDTPTGEVPKTSKTITFAAENLGFAGGSCPANVTMTPHNSQQITLVNWADNCQKITTYAKPMILALATFAALMIVFGARVE